MRSSGGVRGERASDVPEAGHVQPQGCLSRGVPVQARGSSLGWEGVPVRVRVVFFGKGGGVGFGFRFKFGLHFVFV